MKQLTTLLVALFFTLSVGAQNIPSGYYDGTDGLSGQELKVKLHQIIRGHKVRTYGEFRDTILPTLDEDPDNSDNIILFYKNASIPKANFASNNQPDYWNREHTWAKSHGFPDLADTAYTDVHNLRPSDASVNTSKSNKDFNVVDHTVANEEGEAPDTYTNGDFWEPRDEIKGDVARILFYMSTRYESDFLDLELVDRISYSGDPEFGVLYTMLQWHENDPVDQYEIDRHEGAYGFQENRNPFIDHPEWVGEIWGVSSNPILLIDHLSFNPDFGAVELGSSASQQYQINSYNISESINITTGSPFSLSSDGVDYSQNLTLTNTTANEVHSVWIKFEPSAVDQNASVNIDHSTGSFMTGFSVSGREGQVEVISIADARTKVLGEVVSVTGVVIDAGNNSGNSRVIYDGTAGIVVRSFDVGHESANFSQGDSILVKGGLSEYGEALQIEESPITIELLKSNAQLPAPKYLTISEVGEKYESQLVTIENVSFADVGSTFAGGGTSGNFTISDGTGEMVFRIGSDSHPLVGTEVPSGYFEVTGFIGQFFEDYQLSVRDADDLVLTSEYPSEVSLITISEARNRPEGSVVMVKGIVIGGETNNPHNRLLYDGTAGIVIRSEEVGNLSSELQAGDSVEVIGGLLNYNGLLEIEESPVSISLLSSGNELPSPQETTLDQIGEELESERIQLTNLSFVETGTFAKGEYTLQAGETQMTFTVGLEDHDLVGTNIPLGSFDLIGYVGETANGYHIMVQTKDDIFNIEQVLSSENKALKTLIYPNPTQGNIQLKLGAVDTAGWKMSLVDVSGKYVFHSIAFRNELNLSDLRPGIYSLILTSKDQVINKKLIKL
ncbi:endonuclease [Reichenbachiella ulvae]|uniref:Endonuclease n=1 Tax=Reichenbachiella ulvae TaxID=2980104 RepID=A0ABT3CTB2_9BACT|nr:endonuclease [Reichenbachiella ulvae]MCV9386913.1 endonuclease [Reichenbachiella ulvae]